MLILKDDNGNDRSNRIEYLLNVPEAHRMDFFSDCHTNCQEDMEILASWERYFQEKDVPFAVISEGKGRANMIKIKRAEE